MANNRKHVFGTKRGLVFIGVIFFVCVGGLVLLSKWIFNLASSPQAKQPLCLLLQA